MKGKGVAKNKKKAFEMIDKALEIEGSDVEFLDANGELYSMIGDADNALKIWDEIVKSEPEYEKKNTAFVQYIRKIKVTDVEAIP